MKIIRLIIFGLILVFWPFFMNAQTNTNLGYGAGYQGSNNTSVGYYANDIATGSNNSSLGSEAGKSITSGYDNVISGMNAGYNLSSGKQSVFLGWLSGKNTTTGYYNTFIGRSSGISNTTGIGNTYLGAYTAQSNTTGVYNVFIGHYSGMHSFGSRNVFIGFNSGYTDTTGSHHLVIDNTISMDPLIYGEFDNDLLAIGGRLGVNTQNIPDSIQLAVSGTVVAKEGIITTDYFPDFVFLPDYKLRGIHELKAFISKHNHLPDIPPAKVVESQGMKVGNMQKLLLQKIEEITLYMIEIQSDNEQLMDRITKLKAQRE
ncbi:MAG: hypothetical protein ACP5E3_11250 [Bacteroidales bacterium]